MAIVGDKLGNHMDNAPSYMPSIDPGRHGGGTYTGHDIEPTLEAWENIFGPSARDIKQDLQRFKRHGRWHLPDILKGPNQYLTDRIDGLITDAANSLFTSRILPYKYTTNVDGKIKWNVWSFDEGLASRVPYESAARTLTQSKRSYSGYMVRQGMAIVLEHNFMMTQAGRENFKNQLLQLKGSIQLTNDLDVHVALVLAPSYQKTMSERYLAEDKTPNQICREFVDLFGFVQKNQNALDILIEEAKSQLRVWGGPMPDFLMCNPKLTFQLTMTPDRTNYVTQGAEGPKRLRSGPEMSTYRGIGIIHTRAFSMETGAPPRDILRRRVRVAEFYRIMPSVSNARRLFGLYNEERDTWFHLSFAELLRYAQCEGSQNNDRIRHAIADLNHVALRAKGASGAFAPSTHALAAPLGVAGPAYAGDTNTEATLKAFYLRLFRHDIEPEFSMQPRFVTRKLVYVPGSFDMCDFDANNNLAWRIDDIPAQQVIKQAARDVFANDTFFTGTNDRGKDFIKMVAYSVDEYPRSLTKVKRFINTASVVPGVLAPGATLVEQARHVLHTRIHNAYMHYQPYGALVPPNAGTVDLIAALTMRNSNRYAVPTQLVPRTSDASWADASADARLLQCLDHPQIRFNVRLRRIGAFMSPNHYRHQNERLQDLGSLLGYNMLMTRELISAVLMNRTAVNTLPLEGSYLQHVIQHPADHDVALQAIGNALIVFWNAHKSQRFTRINLAEELEALDGVVTASLGANFTQRNSFCNPFYFWTWAATDSSIEDPMHVANNSAFAAAFTAYQGTLGAGNENYTLTKAAVAYMHNHAPANENEHAFTATVTLPGSIAVPDPHTVGLNFMNALAFRLFADQEFEAPLAVLQGGDWPPLREYLTPRPPMDFSWMRVHGGHDAHHESDMAGQTEVVIIRPNIEHYMLGIILGQGGEGLGSTFWGQTELSVYDDSMHGIWGMSYKYHERAMVINERNLVRLWDVAYDGYVGGKDDTYVNWNDRDEDSDKPNSVEKFRTSTLEVTRHYRGPSMMVMAFHHHMNEEFHREFRANWPSPLVYYDDPANLNRAPVDYDNLHVIPTAEFRVFNSPIYQAAYDNYKRNMPDFATLHRMRKNAGLAAVEHEVSSDALAFQGTMRIQTLDGQLVQEIAGSGHHGPDFIGVASLRAGKGYKINSQPTIQRLI